MIRKPVHVDDLADALLELAAGDYRGVLNVAGPDPISRFDLGILIARREGLDPDLIKCSTIAESGLRLAADVRLTIDKATSLLHTRLRGVHEFMPAIHKDVPVIRP
jgi:dTDP-4-dehydrorhamnose reductase